MLTGSKCGYSRASKELMSQDQPQQEYFYYDHDIAPLGPNFMHESLKLTRSQILPDIWICGKFIGGNSK